MAPLIKLPFTATTAEVVSMGNPHIKIEGSSLKLQLTTFLLNSIKHRDLLGRHSGNHRRGHLHRWELRTKPGRLLSYALDPRVFALPRSDSMLASVLRHSFTSTGDTHTVLPRK